MTNLQLLRTIIVILTLEWELCNEDPVAFCYRIGVTWRESPAGDSVGGAVNFPVSACGADLQEHGCGMS